MSKSNPRCQEVPCRVAVERTEEYLTAHVILGQLIEVDAGDTVLVHGEEIQADNGDKFIERRQATVTRANWFTRQWTKLTAIFEITELYEVSFSGRRKV